jgi:hypothetical protein
VLTGMTLAEFASLSVALSQKSLLLQKSLGCCKIGGAMKRAAAHWSCAVALLGLVQMPSELTSFSCILVQQSLRHLGIHALELLERVSQDAQRFLCSPGGSQVLR